MDDQIWTLHHLDGSNRLCATCLIPKINFGITGFSMASWIFSSEKESSYGNEFSLLLSVGKTYLMKELEMRHQQTDAPQETKVMSALSDHPLKNDLTLVAKVSSAAVGVISVEDDQEEAEAEHVVVRMPLLEAKEHLRWRTLQLPKT